jgi:uncharacterized membrane protein SpoIIM required for sporulation
MDIDRFLVLNRPVWDRLDDLTKRSRRTVGRLDPRELDELVQLYQRTSTHLSYASTTYRDPGLTMRLTRLVAAAGAIVYGTRPRSIRALGHFFSTTFPAAVWHIRWFVVVAAMVTLLPAAALGVWLARSPSALDAAAPPGARAAYIDQESNHYYTDQPSAAFATKVFVNNVQVAIVAFAAGALLCVPTVIILGVNGGNLGVAAGLFAAAGKGPKFWGLVLPHGMLELTAVIIAGAAGLRLGWTLIDPGDRLRVTALGEEGRRAIAIVLGLVAAFGVAGTIEGFVTGSPLATPVRLAVGLAAWLAFTVYVVVLGRQAAARGLTGSLGEEDTGWARQRRPVALSLR